MWDLNGTVAHLDLGSVSATVDVQRPFAGIQSLVVRGQGMGSFRPLQVHFSLAPGKAPERITDAYVRGDDLVATFEQSPRRVFKSQIYWRASRPQAEVAVAIDLLISVETALWDSTPVVHTISEIPACECLRLCTGDTVKYEPVSLEHDSIANPTENALPVFLVRPRGVDWSYTEMIHPTDFVTAKLQVAGLPRGFVQFGFAFICRHLEKGVIRTARVRGALIPRENDEFQAAQLFQQFQAAPLPLTR